MATVGRKIASEIIENNGHYYGDPRVRYVIRYRNAWGAEDFAIAYTEHDRQRYFDADSAAINPQVIWSFKDGLVGEKP